MKTHKHKNTRYSRVNLVPEWKYKLLLLRIDRQDRIISKLSDELDDLTDAFRRFSKLYSI